ncbi:hypothetical protein MKW94_018026 [Papaver nudicaule]|uniref:Phytocyanin domain-containing protein n=1 Tax=Papaver nudicaule TaxID=74823 RepID=A0AA41S6H4_PAPNU|nr:hypothetical protein [Papaver nudicaule]
MGILKTPTVCKFLLITLILVGLSSITIVKAAKKFYLVGDGEGRGDSDLWGFGGPYDSWATSRSFVAGDVVVFKYYAEAHNTVRVSSSGYESCAATAMESMNALWT